MEHVNDEETGREAKAPLSSAPREIDCSRMSAEEFHAHMRRGYEDYLEGKVRPAEEVFAEFRMRMATESKPPCSRN